MISQVSIPERVLEALKRPLRSSQSCQSLVSIPERVLEALKRSQKIERINCIEFQSLKGF